jgi:hypothetical protein
MRVLGLKPEGPKFSSHVRECVVERFLRTLSAEGAEPMLVKEVSALRPQ